MVDLEEFMTFMENRRLVPERRLRFYIHWVRRFLQSDSQANSALSPTEKLMVYLDELCRDPAVAAWQVDQAEQAVRLYLFTFRAETATPDYSTVFAHE